MEADRECCTEGLHYCGYRVSSPNRGRTVPATWARSRTMFPLCSLLQDRLSEDRARCCSRPTIPTDTPLPACWSGRIREHSPAHALPAEGSRLPCRLSDAEHAPSPMQSTQEQDLPMCSLSRDRRREPSDIRTAGISCSPQQEASSAALCYEASDSTPNRTMPTGRQEPCVHRKGEYAQLYTTGCPCATDGGTRRMLRSQAGTHRRTSAHRPYCTPRRH